MLCITLKALNRTCGGVSGGIAKIWIFDGADFDFTQGAAATDGTLPAYTTVALATGATAASGAKMFPITFADDTASLTWAQSVKGCSVKYELTWTLGLADVGQIITNFLQVLDAAGCCCGLAIATLLNTGRILIAGERVVNGAPIQVPMKIKQDGSSGGTGILLDDENQHSLVLKGSFGRLPYEFTGGTAALVALQ